MEQAERLPELGQQAQEAQQAGDTIRLQAIAEEGQKITMELQEAQTEVIARPDIAEKVEAFEVEMLEEMKAIDPEIEGILARLQALVARLSVLQG